VLTILWLRVAVGVVINKVVVGVQEDLEPELVYP